MFSAVGCLPGHTLVPRITARVAPALHGRLAYQDSAMGLSRKGFHSEPAGPMRLSRVIELAGQTGLAKNVAGVCRDWGGDTAAESTAVVNHPTGEKGQGRFFDHLFAQHRKLATQIGDMLQLADLEMPKRVVGTLAQIPYRRVLSSAHESTSREKTANRPCPLLPCYVARDITWHKVPSKPDLVRQEGSEENRGEFGLMGSMDCSRMKHLPPSGLIQSKPSRWSRSRFLGHAAAGNRICSGCSGDYEDPERSAPDPDAPGTEREDGCSAAMDPDRGTMQLVFGE